MTAADGDGDHQRIRFETTADGGEERFLREYLLEAADRLPETDVCDRLVFVRAGDDPRVDGGLVVVDVYGDPPAVIERERGTWDALVEDGPLVGWERGEYGLREKLAEHYGPEAVDRHEQLRFVAGLMSRPAFETLAERPAPVEEFPDGDGAPVGWHRVLHVLSNHWDYSIPEELDAYVRNVEMCLKIIGRTEGPGAARERADAIRERLDEVCDELEAETDPPGDLGEDAAE